MKPDCETFDSKKALSAFVDVISREHAEPMIRAHYIGKWPGVVRLSLGLYVDWQPVGVIVFAEPPRETKVRFCANVWELARLWVDDSLPQNTETWFIARALRWIRKSNPEVMAIVSYADPGANHSGVIYRAANFHLDGMTDEGRKTPRFDYQCASTGKVYTRKKHVPHGVEVERKYRNQKFRYIYWLRGGVRSLMPISETEQHELPGMN